MPVSLDKKPLPFLDERPEPKDYQILVTVSSTDKLAVDALCGAIEEYVQDGSAWLEQHFRPQVEIVDLVPDSPVRDLCIGLGIAGLMVGAIYLLLC